MHTTWDITKRSATLCYGRRVIEQYPDDFPWPSCLIFGYTIDGKAIHIVASDDGESSKIITAYIPNTETFEDDLKTRKEK